MNARNSQKQHTTTLLPHEESRTFPTPQPLAIKAPQPLAIKPKSNLETEASPDPERLTHLSQKQNQPRATKKQVETRVCGVDRTCCDGSARRVDIHNDVLQQRKYRSEVSTPQLSHPCTSLPLHYAALPSLLIYTVSRGATLELHELTKNKMFNR
jgi:hypothetical protein